MFYSYSAAALALFSITSVFAQECPAGSSSVQNPGWKSCQLTGSAYMQALQCGTIQVPVDYYNRDAGTMPLRLIRYPAQSGDPATANSIITNPGGPGASGFESLYDGTGSDLQTKLGTKYNVVSFDPRGAKGLTTPGKCTAASGGFFTNDYASQVDYYGRNAEQCFEQDPDTPLYGSTYTARDLKAVAESTNSDGLIRYWGFSYGTALGSTVAAMFPKQISRMILDGNVDANEYYYGQGLKAVDQVDAAVENFFRLCASASKCALNTDGQQTTSSLLAQYNAYRDDTRLSLVDRNNLDDAFFKVLYGTNLFSGWASTLVQKYKDISTQPQQRKRQDDGLGYNPLMFQQENLADEALAQIRCTDNEFRGSGDPDEYKAIDTGLQYTKFGAYPGSGNPKLCLQWKFFAKERFTKSLTSQIETSWPLLILNNIYDPITPVTGAKSNQGAFKDAAVVITEEAGHCVFQQQAVGLQQIVFNYFNTEVKPVSSTVNLPVGPNTNPFDMGGTNLPGSAEPSQDSPPNPNETSTSSDTPAPTGAKFRRHAKDMEKRQLSTTPALPTSTSVGSELPVSTTTLSTVLPTGITTSLTSITLSTSLPTLTSTTSGTISCTSDPYITGAPFTTAYTTEPFPSTGSTTSTKSGTKTGTNTNSATGTTTGTGKATTTGKPYGSSWSNWSGYPSSTTKPATWSTWSAYTSSTTKPAIWSTWSGAATSTTKKVDPVQWQQWSSSWSEYKSQTGVVPYTKTITKDGKSTITVYAVPTVTVYVDYVQDVCPTGIYTNTITVTATCNNGCYAKPTGVPAGYTTTTIYCSACASPAYVTATVKADATWSGVSPTVKPDATYQSWNGSPAPTGTGSWSSWAPGATGIAKYTGAAQINAVPVAALVPALFAGLFWL